MRRSIVLASVIGVGALAASTHALWRADEGRQPAELLPAGAVIFADWDGTQAHKAAWEKSAAYESLEKSGLLRALTRLALSFVANNVKEDGDAAGDFVSAIGTRGFSLALTFPRETDGPSVFLVLRDGAAQEKSLRALLLRFANQGESVKAETVRGRQVNRMAGSETSHGGIAWWVDGRHLMIVYGVGAVDAALDVADGKSASLASIQVWKQLRERRPDFEPIFDACVDVAGLRKRFGGTSVGPTGRPTVDGLFKALGADKVGLFTFRMGLHERALQSEGLIEAPSPRTGLLALLDQKPLSLKDLPPLPAKTAGFTAVRIDASKAYDQLLKTAKDFGSLTDGNAPAQIDAAIGEANQFLGFDLKTDLVDALGSVICLYHEVSALPAPVSLGLAIEVKDLDKLKKSLKILVRVLQAQGGLPATITIDERQGRETFLIDLGPGAPVHPAVCLDKKWMFVGLSPQSIDAALKRVDGKAEAWKPSAAEQAALASAPKEFFLLTLSDPRPTYSSVMSLVPLALPFLEQMFAQEGARSTPGRISGARASILSELPPPATITAAMFPNATTWSVDARGLHIRSRESVPSLVSTSTVVLGAALLLPATGSARAAAQRTQSRNNLKQILLACHNYHDVHRSFPAGTHDNTNLKPEKRFSWQTDLLPYLEQSPVYNQINFAAAWDDKKNQTAVTTPMPVFLNPGVSQDKTGDTVTNYIGLAGLGAEAFSATLPSKKAGVFGYDRATRIQDITDGTSMTAMVSEASNDFGPWAAGGRPTLRALTKMPYFNGPDGIGGPYRGGCNVGFADGSVHFLSKNIDPKVLEKLVTIQGGEPISQEFNGPQ